MPLKQSQRQKPHHFKGPPKDNKGKVVIPAGKEFKQKDTELEKMDWL
jgi:simple sugar transport system substrate-binding protein